MRRFIKTGIIFLGLGVSVGLILMVQRELFGMWPHPHLKSAHVHAVAFGFIIFLILGVALWLFPRAAKDDTRYNPSLISLSYWVLTASTGTRFVTESARAFSDARWLAIIVVLAGLGQAIGLAIYFYTMWTRIRPVGSQLREAKGERF